MLVKEVVVLGEKIELRGSYGSLVGAVKHTTKKGI